jgi:outer membrane protein W
MKFLKRVVASILILGAISEASIFEQNGVKEGNNRVSIGLTSIIDNDDGSDESGTLYGQYGRFVTDNIEVSSYIFTSLNSGDVDYQIAIGANYYFLKTATLTPYLGAQYYYTDSTRDIKVNGKEVDFSSNGNNIHIGAHKFFSENFAISPEVGSRFIDFTDYTNTYANIYLTYFFK